MKDVQGYEGHYRVDELGNVYSAKRVLEGGASVAKLAKGAGNGGD